ncbi:unnamed protein product [Taenia asiatica]|uniref:MICOS complex subunit n=1 Tax=Taenia asiatica TaxID=60517 RepID=A0A0R3WD13_TAEAS|nr:unnamed protein product [Taenia asiatica]
MVCGLGGVVLGSRGVLRQIAYGCLGLGVGTVMCYPSGSLKAMDYAWDSTTSKLIETSEVIKRKYKRKCFFCELYFSTNCCSPPRFIQN